MLIVLFWLDYGFAFSCFGFYVYIVVCLFSFVFVIRGFDVLIGFGFRLVLSFVWSVCGSR